MTSVDRPDDEWRPRRALLSFLVSVRLRTRWRNCLATSIVLGVTVGLGLFAFAGARRTQSSNDRYLRAVNTSTMSVDSFGNFDRGANAKIATLPGVATSRTYVGFNVSILDNGTPDFSQSFEAIASFDGEYFDQDRFVATAGGAPDPTQPDQVAVNEVAAHRYGYQVGQHVLVGVYDSAQYADPSFFISPTPPQSRVELTIVGVGLFPDELLQDDADRTERLLLTPAFTAEHQDLATYGFQGLVLTNGDAGVEGFQRRIREIFPAGAVETHVTAIDRAHARRALRPLSITLAVFGGIAALVGLVLGAQSLRRLQRRDADEAEMLRAFGGSSGVVMASASIGPAISIIGGAVVAVVIAIVASPLMPLGPTRAAQPARFDIDTSVIGVGAAVMIIVLAVTVGIAARQSVGPRSATRRRRPSRLVAVAASMGMPPTATTGLRMALDPVATSGDVPIWSVMAGTTLAVATLITAVSFGASLHTLTHTPHLYGWDWDSAIVAGNGYGNLDPGDSTAILTADPAVAEWSGAYFGDDLIDGVDVPLLGMHPASTVRPPIVRGRMIADTSEIVLGAATAEALGKSIGDSVTLGGDQAGTRTVTVVGIATFPTIGKVHVAHVSLGVGALVDTTLVPGYDRNLLGELEPGVGPNVEFVRYRPGTDPVAARDHLAETTEPLSGIAGLDVIVAQRPAEVVSSISLGDRPLLLAIGFAVLAAASLGIALGASVRHRNRDLAVLKSLGFTRLQLAATVAWHATAVVVVGLIIGVPVGIVGSRALWRLFADQLDVVAEPRVPAITLLLVGIGALAVANVVAVLPARSAASVQTSHVLRQS